MKTPQSTAGNNNVRAYVRIADSFVELIPKRFAVLHMWCSNKYVTLHYSDFARVILLKLLIVYIYIVYVTFIRRNEIPRAHHRHFTVRHLMLFSQLPLNYSARYYILDALSDLSR